MREEIDARRTLIVDGETLVASGEGSASGPHSRRASLPYPSSLAGP